MAASERRLIGLLFLFGASQFLLVMLGAEAAYPALNHAAYSVSGNAISDLGVGKTAVYFNTSIVILGAALAFSSYLSNKTFKSKWFTATLLLAGVGSAGVGLFPENHPAPHTVFALMAFLFGGLSAILFARLTGKLFRWVSMALGLLTLVFLSAFIAGFRADLGFGGVERFIVYPELMWGLCAGGYLMGYESGKTSDPHS
ncbi:MAG: DUF998 domain-containing protein [Thermoprotei archaeon]